MNTKTTLDRHNFLKNTTQAAATVVVGRGKILTGDVTYTPADRAVLAEFSAKLYETDAIKRLKVE